MQTTPERLDADVIVVGSGPGGATVARELARGGQRVLLLERGADHRGRPYFGTYLGALLYADRMSLLFTHEGLNIVRPLMLGGATAMYCGCSAPPPPWLRERHGVDVEAEAAAAAEELQVAPLPPELRGAASTRIAEAAGALGYAWQPQEKFVQPGRAARFDCGAHCMLGCRCGAKWGAFEYVDEAVAAGAELRTGARVTRVLVEGGAAAGVEGTCGGRPFSARAGRVVLAAGGLGTPAILRASGIEGVGEGITMDTTVMVYGVAPGHGIGDEPPMTWSWHSDDDSFMLSTLIDPWLLYPIVAAQADARRILGWSRWGRTLGVMIKVRDEVSGRILPDGSVSKPLTARDRAALREAEGLAGRILRAAGADPASIFTTPLRGTHPGSTARVGAVLDADLQTEVRGLYVCDASAFPEALGRPTVLTIIGMGRRLARQLLAARHASAAA